MMLPYMYVLPSLPPPMCAESGSRGGEQRGTTKWGWFMPPAQPNYETHTTSFFLFRGAGTPIPHKCINFFP